MMFSLLYIPALAFLAVLALIPVARRAALRTGFVDAPGGRKAHEDPVPPIGGLVIFPVYVIVAVLTDVKGDQFFYLSTALGILLVMGALDDRFQLNAWLKFFLQILAAVLVVVGGGLRLDGLGNLFGFGPLELGWMAIPFSLAAVTLLINAINLMDGLDGLAGGKSMVVLFWLVLACALAGEWAAIAAMGPMIGALAGFLFYNMRHPFRDKACVFLGDAGSLGLGLVIAWFSISLVQDPDPPLVPISVAWILALPVIDACGQFYRRVREGRHPFSPDRGHFHHHFVHAGIPVGRSTAMILGLGFVLGGIGYLGVHFGVPEVLLTVAWIGLLFSHMALSFRPQIYINFLSRFHRG